MPITEEDEVQMKVASERCFSLLGFCPETCVWPQQTLGTSVQVAVADPLDQVGSPPPPLTPFLPLSLSQAAGTAMSAMIHALYETNNVGVARFVARKSAAPRLVALLPQIKASHEVIIAGDDVMIGPDLCSVF